MRDGFAVDVAILRRGAGERTFALDLASVRPGEEGHPWVALVRRLLAVETRVAGSEPLAGWRDASGDVRVGPV